MHTLFAILYLLALDKIREREASIKIWTMVRALRLFYAAEIRC
jgi:hypothetical protein